MSEASWGLSFRMLVTVGGGAAPQHGGGQRSASVRSGMLAGGHG